jgi:hypothetical protein
MDPMNIYQHTGTTATHHIYYSTIHCCQAVASAMMHTTSEWIKKMCYVYTMEYSSHEMNESVMLYTDKWMEFGVITMITASQSLMW